MALGFLGSRWLFSRIHLPLITEHFFLTGAEFILVGFLVGPSGLRLLDPISLESLHPLISLSLGWVGILFGLQLDFKLLKKFPTQFLKVGLSQAFLTSLFCFFPFLFVLSSTMGVKGITWYSAAAILSLSAGCTAQSSLAIFQKKLNLYNHHLMDLLRYISSIDAIISISLCGVLASIMSPEPLLMIPVYPWLQWLIAISALGIILGFVLDSLIQPGCRQSEMLVFIIGFVAFTGGLAFYLQHSVIFLTTIIGTILANSSSARRLHAAIANLEKPIYILLLIYAGAISPIGNSWNITLIACYVIVRFLAKFFSGYCTSKLFLYPRKIPKTIGLGLISEGGMSLAIALSFVSIHPGPVADLIIFTVLLGIMISELISPVIITGLFGLKRP